MRTIVPSRQVTIGPKWRLPVRAISACHLVVCAVLVLTSVITAPFSAQAEAQAPTATPAMLSQLVTRRQTDVITIVQDSLLLAAHVGGIVGPTQTPQQIWTPCPSVTVTGQVAADVLAVPRILSTTRPSSHVKLLTVDTAPRPPARKAIHGIAAQQSATAPRPMTPVITRLDTVLAQAGFLWMTIDPVTKPSLGEFVLATSPTYRTAPPRDAQLSRATPSVHPLFPGIGIWITPHGMWRPPHIVNQSPASPPGPPRWTGVQIAVQADYVSVSSAFGQITATLGSPGLDAAHLRAWVQMSLASLWQPTTPVDLLPIRLAPAPATTSLSLLAAQIPSLSWVNIATTPAQSTAADLAAPIPVTPDVALPLTATLVPQMTQGSISVTRGVSFGQLWPTYSACSRTDRIATLLWTQMNAAMIDWQQVQSLGDTAYHVLLPQYNAQYGIYLGALEQVAVHNMDVHTAWAAKLHSYRRYRSAYVTWLSHEKRYWAWRRAQDSAHRAQSAWKQAMARIKPVLGRADVTSGTPTSASALGPEPQFTDPQPARLPKPNPVPIPPAPPYQQPLPTPPTLAPWIVVLHPNLGGLGPVGAPWPAGRLDYMTARLLQQANAFEGLPSLQWPVNGPITTYWGQSTIFQEFHPGVDIAAPLGTPVRAIADGVVRFAGWAVPGQPHQDYGLCVIIQYNQYLSSVFGHLDSGSGLLVQAGQPVRAGQIIGFVGMTGWTTGPHLHFELRFQNKQFDPLLAPGLLP